MTTIQLGHSPSLDSSTKPLSKTQGILLETLQYVEPVNKTESAPVPNHLLESKIYSKIAQNDYFQAKPAVLHFGGIEIDHKQRQTLTICNVSTEVQRMHIIPPQSKYFSIKYTKQERLVPGLNLDCIVEFSPDEFRYYYDCIRIHCKGEENLIIPIHAYPVMNTDDFPTKLNFPTVPVGERETRTITLSSIAPIDFEFRLQLVQPHPAFDVDPLSGFVPANGDVDIKVTFIPSEFSTAQMKMMLVVSQFNAKPLYCTVTGTSLPGLAKQISEASQQDLPDEILDPRCITPVDRARQKRKARRENSSASTASKKEVEVDGIRFPNNLDTPYAVAQVLNQQPGKLRIKDIREAVSAKNNKEQSGMTRQMKEAMFEMAVRQDVYEERQNQLRWQVKLGDEPFTSKARQTIMDEWEQAIHDYKMKRGDPVEAEESKRESTKVIFRRTIRDASLIGDKNAQFDTYTNDMWATRHAALNRFQQAARKVIIRRRADKNIRLLKEARKAKENESENKEKELAEDWRDWFKLDPKRITAPKFPIYVDPDVKDDMAVDALGPVPVPKTEIVLTEKVPFMELKVPLEYKLLGYKPFDVHEAATNYVSPKMDRKLRTGAEDEIIQLPECVSFGFIPEPPPPKTASAKVDSSTTGRVVVEEDMKVEEITGSTPVPASSSYDTASYEVVTLKPPQALFKPIEYPPLHIFNPSPGLQVFQAPLPYAETDSDFHLCPLPRYTSHDITNPHMATQKKYLDREDTIKGVMTWKKFPSQGLTSLANTPTLTNVWVPRWNDTFSTDLLPTEVPTLYDGLSDDDRNQIEDNVEEEEMDDTIQLTPDMVTAQFPAIAEPLPDEKAKKDAQEMFPHGNKMPSTNIPVSSTGPVPREKREMELEGFIKKKYNRLGIKIHQKIENLNSLKTNSDLILK